MKKLLMILMALLILAVPASANDGSVGRNGESVYPMEDNDVEMISEDILLTFVDEGPSRVDCTFVFHNTGEARSVLMGFPALVHHDDDYIMGDPGNLKLRNFTAFRNGAEIEVTEVDGTTLDDQFTDYASWYVFEVPFDKDETLTMTHSYDIGFAGDSGGNIFMGYVLETGRTWKNNIGRAKITFDISAFNGYALQGIFSDFAEYPGFPLSDLRYEDGKLIFEKYDFEPYFNITLWLSYWGYKDWWGISEFRTEEQWESVRFFDEAPDLTPDELIRAYNDLSYSNKLVETLYLNTVLGLPEEQHAPVACKLNASTMDAYILVEDRNFDLAPKLHYKIMNSDWRILHQNVPRYMQEFGDYGIMKFYLRDWIPGDIYEVNVSDYAGNSSSTILNSYGDFHKTTVSMAGDTASEKPAVDNPKTGTPFNSMPLAAAFLCLAFALLIIRRNEIGVIHSKRMI